eukprot:6202000-Pleurochrysis_carterae.AAC.3
MHARSPCDACRLDAPEHTGACRRAERVLEPTGNTQAWRGAIVAMRIGSSDSRGRAMLRR